MLLRAQYILPVTSEPITGGAILVRDGKIRDIGVSEILLMRYPEEEVKDFGLAALMPGLVDTYTSLENSVMRGMLRDVPYTTWLVALSDIATKMEVSDWFASAVLGGLDALSCGITCVGDVTVSGASCTATQRLGLRSVIYREVGAMDKRRVDHALYSAQNDIMHWRAEVDESRVTIGMAPSAIYTCHPSLYTKISQITQREKMPMAVFLAGSREEYNFVKYGSSVFSLHNEGVRRGFMEIPPWLPTGSSPVRYALNWGAFEGENVLAIHCVHVDDEDIKKLREYSVSVAACPRSNAQLGMGVAPVTKFLRSGLNVGLGSGSPAATDSTDIFSEMRIGMMLQRATNPGKFLDSASMLEMATIGGAKALHLDDKIGTLEVGKCADIIAVDLSSSHQNPTGDPVSAVVNTCGASDVLMTMVDGKILYETNKWNVDVEVAKNIARVIEIRSKLRK